MNQNPLEKSKPKLEKGMNEKETKEFLILNGAVPLLLEEWNPGDPIIFVFTDAIQEKMIERNMRNSQTNTPPKMVECLARVDKPAKIYKSSALGISLDGKVKGDILAIENYEEQVDYYAIDSKTGEIKWIRTSKNRYDANNPYVASVGNIYKPLDVLFPKQPVPTKPHEI